MQLYQLTSGCYLVDGHIVLREYPDGHAKRVVVPASLVQSLGNPVPCLPWKRKRLYNHWLVIDMDKLRGMVSTSIRFVQNYQGCLPAIG